MSIDYDPGDTRTHEEYVNTPKADAGSILDESPNVIAWGTGDHHDEESAGDRLNTTLRDIAGVNIVSEASFKETFPKVVRR